MTISKLNKILIALSIFFLLVIVLQVGTFDDLRDNVKIRSIVSSLWAFVGLVITSLVFIGRKVSLRKLLIVPYFLSVLGVIGGAWYLLRISAGEVSRFHEPLLTNTTLYGAAGIVFMLLILAIFGIWKDKLWGYLTALLINLAIFIGLAIYHIKGVFCGQDNCVTAEEISYFGNSVSAFLFVISIFLFYFLRKQKIGAAMAGKQTKLVAGILAIVILFVIGVPTLQAYNQERGGVRAGESEIVRLQNTLNSLSPTYLPDGWELLWETVFAGEELRTYYIPKDHKRDWNYALIIEQKLNPKEDKSYFFPSQDYTHGDYFTIRGEPAFYASSNPHQLWWNHGNLTVVFLCTGNCPLSKEEVIQVAESMEVNKYHR